MMQKIFLKITGTLAHGTPLRVHAQQELSNEYQHDGVNKVFKDPCGLVLMTKVALALEGTTH